MNLYAIALFAHIVGALVLFALLSAEGVGLRFRVPSASLNRILGPISALLILVPGFYMMATQWGFRGWIATGITTYVLIAVLGAFTGISVMRGRMTVQAAAVSWAIRVGLALGVVFDMTVKPDLPVAIAAVLIGAVAGAGLVFGIRREVPAS